MQVNGHTPNGNGGTTVHFGEGENLEVDAVVVSSGAVRTPTNSARRHGVKVSDRGFVEVEPYCRTTEAGVFAIGDLIDTPQLAHVAYAEAILVVKQLLGEARCRSCTTGAVGHLLPPGGGVGRAERRRRQGRRLRRRRRQASVPANSRAQILGEIDGWSKIIAKKNPDGTAGQVLGVHMVGPWVTEQLSVVTAVNWEQRWRKSPSSSSPTRACPSSSARRCSRSLEGV